MACGFGCAPAASLRGPLGAFRRLQGASLDFSVRRTKLDLLWRMPGILYSRSRNSRS
jgi:hypothetical protein